MIKLPNGTFIHDFVVSRPGTIILTTAKGIMGGAQFEYYKNSAWNGLPDLIKNETTINFNWNTGAIFQTWSGSTSIKIYFRFKGPVTGTVTFYLEAYFEANLYIDGTHEILSNSQVATAIKVMTLGDFYEGRIDWYKISGPAKLILSWSYAG